MTVRSRGVYNHGLDPFLTSLSALNPTEHDTCIMAFFRATARASPLTSLSRTPFALAALHTSRPILHPGKTAPDSNIPLAAVGGERVPASQEDDPKQGGEGFFGVSLPSFSSPPYPFQKVNSPDVIYMLYNATKTGHFLGIQSSQSRGPR